MEKQPKEKQNNKGLILLDPEVEQELKTITPAEIYDLEPSGYTRPETTIETVGTSYDLDGGIKEEHYKITIKNCGEWGDGVVEWGIFPPEVEQDDEGNLIITFSTETKITEYEEEKRRITKWDS